MDNNLRRVKITNKKQFELLITLLEKYPVAAKGFKYAQDSNSFINIWEDITYKLNGEGPPARQSIGWQKVWNDIKLKTKKKMRFNKEAKLKNDPYIKLKRISDIEQRVINLLSLEKIGNHEIQNFEISFFDNSNTSTSNSFEVDSQPFSGEACITDVTINENSMKATELKPNKQKRKRNAQNKNNLDIKEIQTDELNNSDNLTLEIRYHLRKMVKLKKEKLKILKEREERDKAESKLKLQILFLEKAKLKKELGITKLEDLIFT